MEKLNQVLEVSKKEIKVLKDLLSVLKSEKDLIISFSLEGLIECNNRKEMLIRKIEFLEKERERILNGMESEDRERTILELKKMKGEYIPLIEKIRDQMKKNMDLISFSTEHVRGLIEIILGEMKKVMGYGNRKTEFSDALSLFSLEA